MKPRAILTLSMLLSAFAAQAQEDAAVPTGADYLKAYKAADCTIPFDVNAEGQPFRVKWGMDAAWDWDYNVNRGIAHIGKGNFETGRVSFQPNDLVTDNGDGTYSLTAAQQKKLKWRIDLIKSTGTTEANINCDHEALFERDKDGNITSRKGYDNYCGKPEEWYKLIKASVQYCQKNGLKIISVSPFNESDFTGWQQYKGDEANGMKDFLAIAKMIKEDPFFDGIRVCGGNTLNCDRALPWYNYLKEYLDEGNTHQLAGEFKTYADFFTTVKADGKEATADELHNVGEAIVGANYGMENGIWWGFDAKARGQFCIDSNEGVRIGYGEDRPHWTSGAVYRNDVTGEVHGYLGSSERQANNSTFEFVSKGRDVFFRGYGPARHWQFDLPGGTGYQKGQINAELLFDITWGEDVAPLAEVNGTYQIMNASSKKMITFMNGGNIQSQSRKTTGTTQQWNVYPGYTDGDCSYWFIDNAGNTNAHLNLLNMNLKDGAGVITYNAGHAHEEQWYIKYAQDGYYYIISRLSNKYLHCSSTNSGTEIKLKNAPAADATESTLKKYLWRFMPVNAKAETNAPAAPTALAARQRPASIELSWTAPADDDVDTYTVLRCESGTEEWNTIARQISGTRYVDNNVAFGHSYIYKVKAVDLSGNRSEASAAVAAAPLTGKALVCQLQFDESLADNTDNHFDVAFYGTKKYSTSTLATAFKSGTACLQLDGKSYAMLPRAAVAGMNDMTIATWVRLGNTTSWQRVFDFGNGTDQYMFFTPNSGSEMRFVMKNGGDEQILTNGKKLTTSTTTWKHVAITIRALDDANTEAILYVDGQEVARKSDFTIKPTDIDPSLCYIGRSMFKSDPMFNGRIDDFRVYNHALSAEEVQALLTDLDSTAADYRDTFEDVDATSVVAPTADHRSSTTYDHRSSTTYYHRSSTTYDLNGRPVHPAAGIVITNGKKQLIRK